MPLYTNYRRPIDLLLLKTLCKQAGVPIKICALRAQQEKLQTSVQSAQMYVFNKLESHISLITESNWIRCNIWNVKINQIKNEKCKTCLEYSWLEVKTIAWHLVRSRSILFKIATENVTISSLHEEACIMTSFPE